jgi:UDP-galactopyranose mutase
MPQGPFPFRAPSPYGELNECKGECGNDNIFKNGETSTAPLDLGDAVKSGDVSTCPDKVDLLIVGAGLSGCVLAERCSKELGMTSIIIDKRDHIGGNCYDFVSEKKIRESLYGAHLFHTKYERVWNYVQEFSEWMPFDHRVRGLVPGRDGEKKARAYSTSARNSKQALRRKHSKRRRNDGVLRQSSRHASQR